jgi:hypothetical protein
MDRVEMNPWFARNVRSGLLLVFVAFLLSAAPVAASFATPRSPYLVTTTDRFDLRPLASWLETLPPHRRAPAAFHAEGSHVAEALVTELAARGLTGSPLWICRGAWVELTAEQAATLAAQRPGLVLSPIPADQAESLISEAPPEPRRLPVSPLPAATPWNKIMCGSEVLYQQRNLTGEGQLLAVIGQDLYLTHKALFGKIAQSKSFGLPVAPPPPPPEDLSTIDDLALLHPVGIALGDDPGRYTGVAPDLHVRVAAVPRAVSTLELLSALSWILDPKTGPTPTAIFLTVDFRAGVPMPVREALWACRNAGIIPIVAAGNNPARITGMAALPECVTIGALTQWKNRALFSGQGPVLIDGLKMTKPDFVEPGVSILGPGLAQGPYRFGSGTLQAAAHFAGIWAQLRQARPLDDSATILSALQKTAEDLGESGLDQETGHGLPVPLAALELLETPPPEDEQPEF